jgi:PIN domain nuclease of toxin-antitoxin system
MMPGYLFDSHALLAFFQKEEGADGLKNRKMGLASCLIEPVGLFE